MDWWSGKSSQEIHEAYLKLEPNIFHDNHHSLPSNMDKVSYREDGDY